MRVEREPGSFTERWHADRSWSTEPDVISLLACVRAGRTPDPTRFADTTIGYRALEPALVRELDGLDAHHHIEVSRRIRHDHREPDRRRRLTERVADRSLALVRAGLAPRNAVFSSVDPVAPPGPRHRIVQVDSHTGDRFVRLGDHAWRTSGEDEERAIELVDLLNDRIVDADNVWTHHWRRGDLVVYDNRMVLHRRVVTGGIDARRVLRRVLVRPTD